MATDPRFQHLLRRAGFGVTAAEAAGYSQRGYSAAVESLIDFYRTPDDVDGAIGQPGYATVTPSAGGMEPFSPASNINDARQRWIFRMVHTRRPLQEKMALFWHQHFSTAYSKIANAVGGPFATQMMAAKRSEHPAGLPGQIELFREYALPNFRDLLVEVAKDPAMLVWLDGRSNTRARPQENFAREIMELFTIGVGRFTEADVYAGARVFTGWNLQRIGDGRDPASFYQFFYQRRSARYQREDVQLSDLCRRRHDDSGAGGERRHAGWRRFHRRACAAPGNRAAAGAQALGLFYQRDRRPRPLRSSITSPACTGRATATSRLSCVPCSFRANSIRRRASSPAIRGRSNLSLAR